MLFVLEGLEYGEGVVFLVERLGESKTCGVCDVFGITRGGGRGRDRRGCGVVGLEDVVVWPVS